MVKNRMYLKIISVILVQAFLCLDICWAAAGQDIVRNADSSTLAPSLSINNVDFKLIMDEIQSDEEDEFALDEFEEGMIEVEEEDDVLERANANTSGTRTDSSVANVSFSSQGVDSVGSFGQSFSSEQGPDLSAPPQRIDPSDLDDFSGALPPPDERFFDMISSTWTRLWTDPKDEDKITPRIMTEEYLGKARVAVDVKQGDKSFTKHDVSYIKEALIRGKFAGKLIALNLVYLVRQDVEVSGLESNDKRLLSLGDYDGRNVIIFYDKFFKVPLSSRLKAINEIIQIVEQKNIEKAEQQDLASKINFVENGKETTTSIRDFLERTGLVKEDLVFMKKVESIVLKNTQSFDKVQFYTTGIDFKKPVGSDIDLAKQRDVRGVFRVSGEGVSNEIVELVSSAVIMNRSRDFILDLVMSTFGLNRENIGQGILKVFNTIIDDIIKSPNAGKEELMKLAFELNRQLRDLGLKPVDIKPSQRRIFGIRTHNFQALRKLYDKNPKMVEDFVRHYVLKHEEGHVMPWPIRGHYLNWHDLRTKKDIFEVFKSLANGNYPGALLKAGFQPLQEISEYRLQVDVIRQSLLLHGYDVNNREPYSTEWVETIANYTAFLKMIDDYNGNDKEPIELMAQSLHIDFELDPSKNFEIDLEYSLDTLHGYLNDDQRSRMRARVLELQLDQGSHAYEASQILKGNSSFGPGSTKLYSVAGPAVFTTVTALSNSNPEINYAAMTAGAPDWLLISAAISLGLVAGVWAWSKLPFFKSVEKRTVQLVNKSIRKNSPKPLAEYFMSANAADKVRIINTASEEIAKKTNKGNPEIFENIFLDGLRFTNEDVLNHIQVKVDDKLKKLAKTGITPKDMLLILNEANRETGINIHKGNSVPVEANMAVIINRMAEANSFDADSFNAGVSADSAFDSSIDRMIVTDFVDRVASAHRHSGNIATALKTVITDFKVRYDLSTDVDLATAQSVKDFEQGLSGRTVRLLKNQGFNEEFIKPLRMAQMNVLFDSIVKYITIKQESNSSALASVVVLALGKVLDADQIDNLSAIVPELSVLVTRMSVEGDFHNSDLFADNASKLKTLSSVANMEQLRTLHKAIVDTLVSQFANPREAMIEIVAGEFDKAGILNNSVSSLASGMAAAVMGAVDGNRTMLIDAPLSEVGQAVKDSRLDERITSHYLFEKLSGNDKEKVSRIVSDIDALLINTLAVNLVFGSVKDIVSKEIDNLGLNGINKARAQFVLVDKLAKGVVLGGNQGYEAGQFEYAAQEKVDELRLASASAISGFAKAGIGTGAMVNQVKSYLRENGTNISLALKEELVTVLNELKVPGRKQERFEQVLDDLISIQVLEPDHAVTAVGERDEISGQNLVDSLRRESAAHQLHPAGVGEVIAPAIGNALIETAI